MSFSSHQCRGRVGWPVTIIAAILLAIISGVAAASGDDTRPAARMLSGAASTDHAWFVLPSDRDPDRWRLLHHPREADGPYYSPQPISLSREPEAMAAFGNRVWVIFPPRLGEDELQQRGVYTVAVEFDRGLDFHRFSPRDRMQIVEALPAGGRLAGFAATDRGPVVLIVPSDEEAAKAQADADVDVDVDVDADVDGDAPVDFAQNAGLRPFLLQLRSKSWHEIDLPAEANITRAARLAVKGGDRSQLVLLTTDPSDASRSLMHRLADDADAADGELRWERSTIDFDLRRVYSIGTVRGRIIAVTQGQPRDPARLQYLRPTRALDLGELPMMRGRWIVLGMADGLRMIEYSTRDGAMMRRIDPVTAEVRAAEVMIVQRLPVGRVWYTSLLLLAAVVAVALVLLVRPSRQEKVELPKGVGVMPPFARCLALVMDLFPGGVVSVLVLRVSPLDVLRLPIFTDSLELAAPFLVMVAVAFAHMTLTEWAKATTLGKALLGARVISTNGDRPSAKQVLIRNGVKVLILLVPVLAIFALLNPNLRGFNDLVARTVVVGDVPEEDEGEKTKEGGGEGE